MQQPVLMDISASSSANSIETSPFHQPSSRRLFQDTPTASRHPEDLDVVSPPPYSLFDIRTPTGSSGTQQDVFGKIDHTPLRQETHSTSPLPNSRSLQMGDMLDHVLNADQYSSLSVGNIIAPERNSSKKPPKRLPTDPSNTVASPTPLSRTAARSRSSLSSMVVNHGTTSDTNTMNGSPSSDVFMQRSHPSSEEISSHVKHRMAALQESPRTH